MTTKPRVHIKTLSGCEGCQDCLEHSDPFVPLLGIVDIIECRLLTSPVDETVRSGDIVIFEGAPITEENVETLRAVREVPGVIIIAMGTCAALGGVQGAIPEASLQEVRDGKWGEHNQKLGLTSGKPVSYYIHVDAVIPGCPIDPNEFVEAIAKLLSGSKIREYKQAVCSECQRIGCLLDEAQVCLAMISVAGCGALCPMVNRGCLACRGLLSLADREKFIRMLVDKGFTDEDIRKKLSLYNAFTLKREE